MKLHLSLCALALLVLGPAGLSAQAPVQASSDPESLFTDPDPQLNANKQVVLHIVRDLLEAGHWADAPKYLTERYIQHNPNFASGREPIMKAFGRGQPRPIPGPNAWRTKVAAVVAEGDLVVVATRREMPNPRQQGQTYTTTWFDMWRIQDGKADEHWDYGTIAPPGAGRGRGGQ